MNLDEHTVNKRFAIDIERYTGIQKILNAIEDLMGNKHGFSTITFMADGYYESMHTLLINIKIIMSNLFTWDKHRFKDPMDQYRFLGSEKGQTELKTLLIRKLEKYTILDLDDLVNLQLHHSITEITNRFKVLTLYLVKTGEIHEFGEVPIIE